MPLVDALGVAVAGATIVQQISEALTGERSVVVRVENTTGLLIRRVMDHHDHGQFNTLPSFEIPPGTTDVFTSQNTGFPPMTGTQGSVTYAGAGYFFNISWSVPWLGDNASSTSISDDLPGRYESRSDHAAGTTRVPIRFELKAITSEFSTIQSKADQLRSSGYALGDPVADETDAGDGRGRFRRFQKGRIVTSPSTGAHWVYGAIERKYVALGGTTYGYPTCDEMLITTDGGRLTHFQEMLSDAVVRKSIYWHPSLHPTDPMLAAHEVRGAIRDLWAQTGWEQGRLGYPVTDEMDWAGAPGGRTNEFQSGTIVWDPQRGARIVSI